MPDSGEMQGIGYLFALWNPVDACRLPQVYYYTTVGCYNIVLSFLSICLPVKVSSELSVVSEEFLGIFP